VESAVRYHLSWVDSHGNSWALTRRLGYQGSWCERIEELPPHVLAMSETLLRKCAEMTWEQAIAMEEFAEPMCFTTEAHRDAVARLLSRSG
jgi:hypothetical protein